MRRWTEKRTGKSTALQRQGVAINGRDLVALPVPVANLLWRDLHVRNAERQEGKQKTQNVRVDILVEGKRDYHLLAGFLSKQQIESEIVEKLDAIVATAARAKPRGNNA